jgi:LPS-assembly protein
MKKFFLSLLFFLFLITPVFAYDIDIEADTLEYNQDHDKVSASGNVSIFWQGKKLMADNVDFEFENQVMNAYGSVVLEEDNNIVFASSITYYYDAQKGELKKTKAASDLIFIQAESLERLDKNNFESRNTQISNCDLDEPHTYFKAKKAKLTESKKLILYGVIVYAGPLPIFYFPVLSRNLERGYEPFVVTVEPGYSQEGGAFLKTAAAYSITPQVRHTIFLDYLGSYGTGYGTQLDYSSSKVMASVYGYNINDEKSHMQRWAIKPFVWAQVADIWTVRSQAEFLSDPFFNSIYNRDNWNRISLSPHNYLSITRSGQSSSILILLEGYNQYNYETKEYEAYTQSLPQISYTLYPRKLFLGLANNFNTTYAYNGQNYSEFRDFFYKNTVVFEDILAKDFLINKSLTITPMAGVGGSFYDKNDLGNDYYTNYINYIGGVNSRLRITNWMDWNFDFLAKTISQRNKINVDDERYDYGIINESLGYTNYAYITDNAVLRNSISYDLRNLRTGDFNRWSSFESEITYMPLDYVTIYARQMQEVHPKIKFEGFQSEIEIGYKESKYIKFGIFYQELRNKEVDNLFGIGFWISPKWRIDYNMRTTSNFTKQTFEITEHEMKLYRDLHCYNFGITWRVRKDIYEGQIHEFSAMFNLKTNMPFNKQKNDQEELFYPWK